MYLSDRDALQYASRFILILVPFFSSLFSTWSWVVEILLLFAVFIHTRNSGLKLTVILLSAGYLASFVPAGIKAAQIGYTPWAGILLLLLKQRGYTTSHSIFWSLLASAVINAVPMIPSLSIVLQPDNIQKSIQDALAIYEQQGTISALEKQGMNRADFEGYMQRALSIYYQLLPAISSILGMLELALTYWLYRLSLKRIQPVTPFILFRLPWYSVWVAIIGLACYLGGDYLKANIVTIIGMNIMVLAAALSLVIGFSSLAYLIKHPKVPKLLFILIIISIIFFSSWIIIATLIVGLFDPVFNFRRLPEFNKGAKS